MPRSMVGLLAAVGAAMSALVGLTHGDFAWAALAEASAATGLAAYLALPSTKKNAPYVSGMLILAAQRKICGSGLPDRQATPLN